MTALIRYHCSVLLLSQRYLAPVLLFVSLIVVLTSSDSGPLAATYSSCAGAMLLCSTWLTMTLAGLEDRTHRSVVVVGAGGSLKVLVALVCTALLSCLPLTGVGVVLPLLIGRHDPVAADLLLGALAQLICALTGVAVGLVCSRPVFRRQGYGLVLALALLFTVTLAQGLPVNLLFTDLLDGKESADLLGDTIVPLTAALVALVVGTAVTQVVTARKD
ncbi:hypothetical protein [Streptomyces uncialis]|uniref:hypothetical protein n=1 Tax=Streptomyces uncialis TaxID=1048205 RepID=UPI00386D2E49|nr:hypothetical protein OG268_15755 [Streptomyces uncialis]